MTQLQAACWYGRSDGPYVINGPLFLFIAVQALYQSQQHSVGIVLNPAPAVQYMRRLLQILSEGNEYLRGHSHLRRIICLTPEGIRGDTFDVGLVVAVQQRTFRDWRPGGHNMDENRLWTSISRFSWELNIYIQRLAIHPATPVGRLQNQAMRVGRPLNLQHSVDCVLANLSQTRPQWNLSAILREGSGALWSAHEQAAQESRKITSHRSLHERFCLGGFEAWASFGPLSLAKSSERSILWVQRSRHAVVPSPLGLF